MAAIPNSIVTWQPVLTNHQTFTFVALAKVAGRRLEANVIYRDHPDRVGQGWTSAAEEGIDLRVHGGQWTFVSLLWRLLRSRQDIHVFCSPWEKLSLILCLFACAGMGCRYYLISEPYSESETPYFGTQPTRLSRIKKQLRPMAYWFYGRMIRRSVRGVFAISDLAQTQYAQIGIDPRRIVPFGYFVPPKPSVRMAEGECGATELLRVAFVGSINARKGIDTLLDTCRILEARNAPVRVDVYGPGDLSLLKGAPGNLSYYGRIPFGETQDVLAEYDAMVLLSRHDGWAVVVNEALLAGRPVVCTETVGASRLVREHEAGLVVPVMDPERTADALERLATDPAEFRRLQAGARRAAEAIRPERAAEIAWRVMQSEELGRA